MCRSNRLVWLKQALNTGVYVFTNQRFHGFSDGGDDILLMKNDVAWSARNAAHQLARGCESLKMADNRPLIEQQIRDNIIKTLTDEKLGDKIVVSQVQVRAITPAPLAT